MLRATSLLQRAATSAARSASLRVDRVGVCRARAAATAIKTQLAARTPVSSAQTVRFFSGSRSRMHSDDGHVELSGGVKPVAGAHGHDHDHDHDHEHDDDDDDEEDDFSDMEDVVDIGPSGKEFGGPQRGGKFKEPTRFGDWERKGRCSDF